MMIDHLLEVSSPSYAYIILGGFVVAFSMVSLLVKEKLYINEVVLGTGFGVLMGPHCANIFDPRSWTTDTNRLTLEVMRVVLATGLFAIGVELPQSYMAKHAKSLVIMVVPTMAFGWLVSAGFVRALFPNLSFISGLAIAACLTPTDPIICAAIVGGRFAVKHVPLNLRRLLAAESASNDGLAYPFLSISLYLTTESSRRAAIGKWFLIGWLYQVILGVILGSILGYAFSQIMKYTQHKGFIDRQSYVAQYLALAVFTIGVTSTLGSDDLLAAFAAGSAISWDGHFNLQTENEMFSSVIDLVLNCACFIYIGAWIPFEQFNAPDLGITPWRLVVLFLVIVFLRRIPPLLLLYKWIPEIRNWREAMFSGHFGPMGVGAIFISTLALTRLESPQNPPQNQEQLLAAVLQPIVAFVVLCSIIIHGLSIPFFSFGRKVGSRTVTLSRSLTVRGADTPDWLLWARRSPASPVAQTPDVEPGSAEGEGIVVAKDGTTDAPVMKQDQMKSVSEQPLGEAGMLLSADGDQRCMRRTSVRNVGTSEDGDDLGVNGKDWSANRAEAQDGGVDTVRIVDELDVTDEFRTSEPEYDRPIKTVHFPSSQ